MNCSLIQPMYSGRGLVRSQPWRISSGPRPARCIAFQYRAVTLRQSGPQRHSTTEAGEGKSGHIRAGPHEGILFFDNVFPIKLSWFLRFPFRVDRGLPELMKRFNNPQIAAADPMSIIKRAIPSSAPIKIIEILPRLKDGGAFVKFTYPEGIALSEIEGTLKGYLKEEPIKPWFNPFRRVRTFLVLGRPWLEDLYRLPSSRLKVEFVPTKPGAEAVELSQESLYTFFRRYGKLADIIPQVNDSKVIPKFAYLDFARLRHAIMAKNCMHGFIVAEVAGGGPAGTELRLSYERRAKAHWIRDWLFSHPRLVIPALAALIATFTVAVFDPIRTFFVKAHIEHSFRLDNSRVYKWFKGQVTDIFAFRHRESEEAGMRALWEDRKDNIEQIRSWLMETTDTFIVVQGPRGSGKKELVIDQALKGRKNTLVIDCKPIQEAKGDSTTINAAAAEVGYRPVFSWMNNFSSLVDLAAQGTIGTKTGFSETLDTQLAKIWQNTATALKQIAVEGRKKKDKDASLSDDEYLEAHPERRSVVVIDNFLHRSQESSLVYDKLAEWAAALTANNIAHVIFLTHDVSFSKSLSKALPDRVFRQISLGDCTPEVAKRFVLTHLDADADDASPGEKQLTPSQRRRDLGELDQTIAALGGRLTDLEFLARRMKTGETPNKAVQAIIEQSASEILKMYLLDVDRASRQWTPQQAWLLVRALSQHDSLRYNEILLSDTYKSQGESVLQALEQAELISIHSENGRPHSIGPGKPVYKSAFRLLTEDKVLSARLDLSTTSELIKLETQSLEKYEKELELLGGLPGGVKAVENRAKWLLGKLRKCHEKIEEYETETSGLKAILRNPPGQTSAAYTPDGQRLITAGVNNAIRVYKTGSDGEPVNVDDCQESNTAVAATNDFFITGSEDGTVCQYSLETHTLDKVLVRCTLPIRDVAISPNGTWVAVASDELVVKVVNVEDMTRIVFLREQQKPVKHVSFHPDGTLLAASCTDGIIYMYSLSNEEDPELVKKIDGLIRNLETDAEASSRVAWHPDGRAFAVPTATRDIQIVSRNDWEKQRAFTGGHRGDITDISWSPNGAILATAGADRHILLWDSPTQKIIAKYDFANILSIAWHPTENLMSFSNSDGEVYIYEDFVPPDHASLMYRPLQPAPFIHDPNATRGKALPSRGRDAVPQQRARGRTPDSLNDILGSDMDEDQDDFLVDDDGAGYGDGTNTHGKRSNGHLDTLSRPNGKRRATDDSFRSRTHDSFQPGSTSWRGNRRYLCLNLIGSVWTVDQESHHTVTVDFYDRTSHRDFHFTDPYLYDKACLTTHGSLFSCPPTATAPAHLYYRPHSPWTSTRTDFRTPLPPGERILSISLTTSYIIAATSNSYIRIYTPYGTPLSVHRAKSSQTVTIASSGDHLFTIGNGPVDAFTGAAQLTYTITNLRRDEVCQANDIVALPAADSEDQQYEDDASFAGIKTALFSAEGDPCIYDNTGVLLVLLHWRQAGQARWVPLLDTKRLRRLASGRKEETYWPVGVAGGKFHCIILKGGDRSPYFPRPLLSEFPFDLPLHPPPAPGDTPTEGTEDGPEREQHQGEREVEKLEQSHGLATLLLKLEEDRIEGRNAPSDQDLRNVMRKGIEVDKLLLQLLAVECRGGEERGMKALDLVKRLKDDGEDGKMLEAAIKIADRFGRENLAAKIRTLAEDRLLGVITADDEDESEGL